jgi:hypothetical protein
MQNDEFQTGPDPLASARSNADPSEAEASAETERDISSLVATAFSETLRRVALRLIGEGADAEQAIAGGAFVLDDSTVVIRLNPETNFVEFFCDVGQPDTYALEAGYRAALEANLCRTFPGVTLGIHPESGRLVATMAFNGFLVDNEELFVQMLQSLVGCAKQIRESGLFAFEG